MSEIVTIILLYHQSSCKNFEHFYKLYLGLYKAEFPNLLSYNRFIELKPRAMPYLMLLIRGNKVFKGPAAIGKTTKGWFYGFKLHLIINEKGDIMNLQFTKGNVDDRTPVPNLTKHMQGLLFGDK